MSPVSQLGGASLHPSEPGLSPTGPSRARPDRAVAEPSPTRPSRARPGRAEPDPTEPSPTRPSRARPGRAVLQRCPCGSGPPAAPAPCPAVTPTGNERASTAAAAASQPPGPPPPRLAVPPLSAACPHPEPSSLCGRCLRSVTGASQRSPSIPRCAGWARLSRAPSRLPGGDSVQQNLRGFLAQPDPSRTPGCASPADVSGFILAQSPWQLGSLWPSCGRGPVAKASGNIRVSPVPWPQGQTCSGDRSQQSPALSISSTQRGGMSSKSQSCHSPKSTSGL